jgi:hypothetical protein
MAPDVPLVALTKTVGKDPTLYSFLAFSLG